MTETEVTATKVPPAAAGHVGTWNSRTVRETFGLSKDQVRVVVGQICPDGALRPGADAAFDMRPLRDATKTLAGRLPRLNRRLRPAERRARRAEQARIAADGLRTQPIQAEDGRVYSPAEARDRANALRSTWEADEAAGMTHHGFGPRWLRPLGWVLGLSIEVVVAYLSWVTLLNAAGNMFRMFVAASLAVAIPAMALFFAGEAGKAANLKREMRATNPGSDAEDDAHRRMIAMIWVAAGAVLAAMAVIGLRILETISQDDQVHRWVLTLAAAAVAVLAPYMEFAVERDNGSRLSRTCVDLERQIGLRKRAVNAFEDKATNSQDQARRHVDRWRTGPLARTHDATAKRLEPADRMRHAAHCLAGQTPPPSTRDALTLPTGAVDTTRLNEILAHATTLASGSPTPSAQPSADPTAGTPHLSGNPGSGAGLPPHTAGTAPAVIDLRPDPVGRHARTD